MRIGLSWDFYEGMPSVDLDVAAVAYDQLGNIIDAAYYNKLSICDGAIVHSGDCKDGTTRYSA